MESVYSTENGQRDFSDTFSTVVQGHYYAVPLLTPGTNYTFSITAFTSSGKGPAASVRTTLNSGREGTIYGFCC